MKDTTRRRTGRALAALLAADGLIHLYWATGLTWPAPDERTLSLAVLGSEVSFGPAVVLPLAALTLTASAAVLAHTHGGGTGPARPDAPHRGSGPHRTGRPHRDGNPSREDGPHRDSRPLQDGSPHPDGSPLLDGGPHRDSTPHPGGSRLPDGRPLLDGGPHQRSAPVREDGPRRDRRPIRDGSPHPDRSLLLRTARLVTAAVAAGLALRGLAGVGWAAGLLDSPTEGPFRVLNLALYTPVCLGFGWAAARLARAR